MFSPDIFIDINDMKVGMNHILWVENTEATAVDLSIAVGKDVTLIKSISDLKKCEETDCYDVVVIDELVENAEQLFLEIENKVGDVPVLVLSDTAGPFKRFSKRKVAVVKAPFDIYEIKRVMTNLGLG